MPEDPKPPTKPTAEHAKSLAQFLEALSSESSGATVEALEQVKDELRTEAAALAKTRVKALYHRIQTQVKEIREINMRLKQARARKDELLVLAEALVNEEHPDHELGRDHFDWWMSYSRAIAAKRKGESEN